MRRRSWYTRDLPRRKGRKKSPILLIGFGLAAGLVAIVALVMIGGSEPTTSTSSASDASDASDGEPGEPASSPAASSTISSLPPPPTDGFGLVQAARGHPFIWPVNGRLTAEIGPSNPGIEIALLDATIMAAARGTITLVSETQGVPGVKITIDHGNGLQTSYEPVDRALVARGDVVRQGEPIGLGVVANGSVGLLHFEVTIQESQVDPLDVLPPQATSAPDPIRFDCANEVIVIASGAPLSLDFKETLGADAIVTRASVLDQTGSAASNAPQAWASIAGPTSVLFETMPNIVNSGSSAHTLLVEIRGSGQREHLTCTIVVQSRVVEPSPFFLPPTPAPQPSPTGPTLPPTTPTRVPVSAPTQAPVPAPTNTPETTQPTPTKTPFPS